MNKNNVFENPYYKMICNRVVILLKVKCQTKNCYNSVVQLKPRPSKFLP